MKIDHEKQRSRRKGGTNLSVIRFFVVDFLKIVLAE